MTLPYGIEIKDMKIVKDSGNTGFVANILSYENVN
jgi:hypothetical protein